MYMSQGSSPHSCEYHGVGILVVDAGLHELRREKRLVDASADIYRAKNARFVPQLIESSIDVRGGGSTVLTKTGSWGFC